MTAIKANWLANHGHDIYIVTTDQSCEPDYYSLHPSVSRIDLGIGFDSYREDGVFSKYYKKIQKRRTYEKKLKEIVDDWKPNIIVSTFNNESEFLYKWDDGSKKVLEYHFCHAKNERIIKYGNIPFLKKIALRVKTLQQEYIARKYDVFVVLTQEDAQEWKGYTNLSVIPNMVSDFNLEQSSCDEKRVIAVGRLDFQKSFDRLINIWSEVYKLYPDWHLDIYGKGPDKCVLETQIKQLGISEAVAIHEPTIDIMNEYKKSSIFAMTSVYEGLPLVLIEAMSVGIPAIVYDFKCGPRDIITNGIDGFIINYGCEKDFTKALLTMIQDKDLRVRMGIKAKIKAGNYSIDTIMHKWQALFNELK